jgi:hypothetical protein
MVKKDAPLVVASGESLPLIKSENGIKGHVLAVTLQRAIRRDVKRHAIWWWRVQSAFFVAVTVNAGVESHERVLPANRY